ncbi:MAG: ankyrin repeat domain-containing protein [Bradymonadales bacterium]|nr:MAG: ankyrin repeat domain-containing protein [Bradymonadales bacterium]
MKQNYFKTPVLQCFFTTVLSMNALCAFACPTDKLNLDLIDAIHRNRLDLVDALFSSSVGIPSLELFTNNKSPLHRAIESGKDSLVRGLLEQSKGMDPSGPKRLIEAPNLIGDRAIHVAATYDHANIIRTLKEYGVDVSARNNRGETALHAWAAYSQILSIETLRSLIEVGVSLDSRSQLGRTALMLLATRRDSSETHEAINLLLDAGADINAASPIGDITALETALFNNRFDTAELLMQNSARITVGAMRQAIRIKSDLLAAEARSDKVSEHERNFFSRLQVQLSENLQFRRARILSFLPDLEELNFGDSTSGEEDLEDLRRLVSGLKSELQEAKLELEVIHWLKREHPSILQASDANGLIELSQKYLTPISQLARGFEQDRPSVDQGLLTPLEALRTDLRSLNQSPAFD